MDEIVGMAFELLVALTGRLVLHTVSLGRLRYGAIFGGDHHIHGASGALWYTRDGQRVVTPTGQTLAGLVSCVALALVLLGRVMG